MAPKPILSVVSPVYRAESIVSELLNRVRQALTSLNISYEIILVDDGSPGQDWVVIQQHAADDPRIRGIRLSRNFGQHHAITAGLEACSGEWIVVMDCDLQDQPEEIGRLYAKAQEGFQAVLARRGQRTDH
ncbi:glycosyltransferase family 2 protein, partial [Hymenobacter sp. AT01-02]|uniref:glycosyltransferase family 2 protein n=1 Tax=Hymenobacter sp. AT01-02 TaxID=1571877 RepID=UPI000AF4710F